MPIDIFSIAKSQGITPALYSQIQPLVENTVNQFGTGRNLTEADITRMTNQIVADSRYRGLPATGYGGGSLNELVRLLVLLHLFNNGYNVDPFWILYFGGIPLFLLPFLGGRRPNVRPVPPIRPIPPVRPFPPIGQIPSRPRPRR
ncbi:MAG: hypothetical protein HFE66_08865 [Clostridiales bacterium]|nr:hypothetical protein [Clostridiales bacterium]